MAYNFDEITDRHGTDCLKYDFYLECGVPKEAKPFWIADMDFPTAPCVTKAIQKRAEHGVFGYTDVKFHYTEAVQSWYERRFSYKPSKEALAVTPGVVSAICISIYAFTKPGEGVLIQSPVYYPFKESILALGRECVDSPLIEKDGRYEMDYDDMEKKASSGKVKLFILCSPHNPVGRVWTQEELDRVADVCARHGVKVFADEIHSDFVYLPHKHTPFPSLSPDIAAMTVWGTSPTKTFNLAGLQVSNIFIENSDMRAAFCAALTAFGYSQPNTLGLTAAEAAYREGEEWFDALLAYIKSNMERAASYLKEHHSPIKVFKSEGTYLLWLDCRSLCRALQIAPSALDELMLQKARLWLDGGAMFGSGGEGFQRMNAACPWKVLEEGLERLVSLCQRSL